MKARTRGCSGVERRSRGVEVAAGTAATDDDDDDADEGDAANGTIGAVGELDNRRLGLLSSCFLASGFGLNVEDA